MSEEKAVYRVVESNIIDELRDSGALSRFDEGFCLPTPEQIKALRIYLGLPQVAFAKIVGVTYREDKGSQTVRKWETSIDKKEHRTISYSAWRLFLVENHIVKVR